MIIDVLEKNIKTGYAICTVIIILAMFSIIKYNVSQCATEELVKYNVSQCATEELVKKEVNRIKDYDITGNAVSLDSWGNSIKYGICNTTNMIIYIVCSAGRDGKFDTLDDIISQTTKEK